MFYLRFFGSPTLESDDVAVPGRATQRHRLALLALLAMAPARRMSRDKLIAYLWPDRDAEGGRNLLKVSTYQLRSVLGDNALLSEGDDLRLNTEQIVVDVAEYDVALERRDYTRAVELYKGTFLDGFFLPEANEFDSWAERERERLAGGYRTALEALAKAAEDRKDPHAAVEFWKARAAHDPYDSGVALRVMESMAAVGNRAGALQHASVHERLLQEEFGVGLPQEIARLVEQLRKEPPAPPPASPLPAPANPLLAPASEPATPAAAPARAHRFTKRSLIPVATILLIAIIAAIWSAQANNRNSTRNRAPANPAIAVLPFENVGNADDEYFAAGMTDEITSRLGAASGLGVVPSRATVRYARTNKTMREIGRELGVDYVLLGSVHWAGAQADTAKRVRVTLELLRASDERQLWTNTYDRVIDDLFEVQSDIATQVVNRLGVTLAEPERRQLRATPAGNHEAYTLYLKGRYFWNKRREDQIQVALDYFRQAVAIDPKYSLAWVGIADVWIFRGWYSQLAPRETFPKAKEAATRALQYDSTLADAHASLAHILFEFDHDWPAAEREYLRAIELQPDNAIAHHWYGGFLSAMGRHEEAMQHAETARTLDPTAPIIQTWKGLRYYFARQHAAAIGEYNKALELAPDFGPAHWHLGWAYEQTGRHQDGIAEARRALASDSQNLLYLASLGHAYARAGMRNEARATLTQLTDAAKRRHVSAYHVALIHVALGELDTGLDWLERAFDEQSPWIGYLAVDPRMDPVRAQPRFVHLLERARLRS
ncbi:MAG TPA: tetratricopeptide repeat protein [Longimicrobiales bacterium]